MTSTADERASPTADRAGAATRSLRAVPRLGRERLAEIDQLEAFRPGFRERLIGLFADAVSQQMPVFENPASTADQVRRAAHAVKGAAAGIGAQRLEALAHTLEQDAKQSIPLANREAELQVEMQAVLAALAAWSVGSAPTGD